MNADPERVSDTSNEGFLTSLLVKFRKLGWTRNHPHLRSSVSICGVRVFCDWGSAAGMAGEASGKGRASSSGHARMTRGGRTLRRIVAAGLLLALPAVGGCTFSVAGPAPPPLTPPLAAVQPRVEYTVSAFSFGMGGREMVTSFLDGRLLSKEIMRAWQRRGYVADAEYVDDGTFSWTADYDLTLTGCQKNATTYMREALSILTLLVWPYPVERTYDLHFVLEEVASGAQYEATVTGTDTVYVQLFFVLAYPFNECGHLETMARIGDHLYADFERQGAFARMTALPEERWDREPIPHTPASGDRP